MVGRVGDLLDADGHFQDAYGLTPGEWVLVRPDGYVGAIIDAGGIEALEAHLRSCDLSTL
jgi:hypothetical protein